MSNDEALLCEAVAIIRVLVELKDTLQTMSAPEARSTAEAYFRERAPAAWEAARAFMKKIESEQPVPTQSQPTTK